jgi:nicotinamide riboside kinase
MKLAFTGPESTGKTTLSKHIAEKYHGIYVPEIARDYLTEKNIGLNYTTEDVYEIAKLQYTAILKASDAHLEKFIAIDTELIAIEIWLEFYGFQVPSWISEMIYRIEIDYYFLMDIDVPWVADPLRANPNDRAMLLEKFKRKLNFYNKNWTLVSGNFDEREAMINSYIEKHKEDCLV